MREHREKCGERKRNEIAGYVRQSNLCVSGDSDTTLDNNFRHGSGQKANLANTHTHTTFIAAALVCYFRQKATVAKEELVEGNRVNVAKTLRKISASGG